MVNVSFTEPFSFSTQIDFFYIVYVLLALSPTLVLKSVPDAGNEAIARHGIKGDSRQGLINYPIIENNGDVYNRLRYT